MKEYFKKRKKKERSEVKKTPTTLKPPSRDLWGHKFWKVSRTSEYSGLR